MKKNLTPGIISDAYFHKGLYCVIILGIIIGTIQGITYFKQNHLAPITPICACAMVYLISRFSGTYLLKTKNDIQFLGFTRFSLRFLLSGLRGFRWIILACVLLCLIFAVFQFDAKSFFGAAFFSAAYLGLSQQICRYEDYLLPYGK